ncbi:ATP-dependent DNA ligase [Yinghuangia soli]|uniref:DNA ligase n=1 Tax=Yinghuangia soli TaxID=2908204 RepID=A0AA41PVI5_9ACTN|nr:DNA ligase [Yinghuangia soli]MCF2526481.1 DNA ligase [Yinghuangia soli]
MRPKAAREVPAADALPGGVQYSIKLDGFRAVAFARGSAPAVLQSRSERDLAPDFPDIARALAALPDGLVLDGELCAWHEGRFAFGQLVRSSRARARDEVAVAYVAFDLLAIPGHDVRDRPLRERWGLLQAALAGTGPPLQIVLATTDRAEALTWREALAPTGVEGLVAKGLDTAYRPKARPGWVKIRDTDTVDALVVAYTGTPRRPRALIAELADGTRALTAPQLDARQAREIAEAAAGRSRPPEDDPEHGPLHPVDPLPAEVLRDPGRTPYVRFVRLRGD